MGKNAHYTVESAWTEISKVKSTYNQQKLIELYHMAVPFIEKYDNAAVTVLSTREFAVDYLPILRLILKQSAGKKFLLSFIANPWTGITRSLSWMIWLPTKVGSHAAMTVLRSYETELELQARGPTINHIATQTDFDDPKLLVPDQSKSVDHSSIPDLVPNMDQSNSKQTTSQLDDTAATSGIGCNTDNFSSSDGETDEIMAQFLEKSLKQETPDKPVLNSTIPMMTPSTASARRPSGPRKLTKGSRRQSLKDSGVNLTSVGAWEDSRKARTVDMQPAENILAEEIEEIDLTELEISQFENGDDVFEDSSDSFVQIPSDAE